MEEWQIEALEKLLHPETGLEASVNVSESRVYLYSAYYGDTRYHMVSRTSDGDVVIDQTDHTEKYQQRVTLEEQEVEPFLRALLCWHLDKVQKQNEQSQTGDDALGDLDQALF